MERAKNYAIRAVESGMTLEIITDLFKSAMQESANRERARIRKAINRVYDAQGEDYIDHEGGWGSMASHEIYSDIFPAIQPRTP